MTPRRDPAPTPSATVLSTESVPVGTLREYPGNPRLSDLELIRQSVRAHGQYRAIVVNRPTMQVLAGNHLLRALVAEGHAEALVHFVDVDAEEAARIVLVDNRASDVGGYDETLLADLLRSVPTLEGTGYEQRDLDRLLGKRMEGTAPPLAVLNYEVVVSCADEQAQRALLERLQAEGLRVKAVIS